MKTLISFCVLVFLVNPCTSWAWGRRGHETIGVAATYLAAGETGTRELIGHSYDIGYYCNVPDFLWKRPASYDTEKPQHFMDLEIFERAFKNHPEIKKPFELARKDFDSAFPEVDVSAGRAYWRIRELNEKLQKAGADLRAEKEQKGKAYQALQEKWMINAGVICHYVGDLSMPLHVSENYDGKLSNQSGIHSYFEDTCVDQMYPKLADKVTSTARAQWKGFLAKNKTKSVLEMLQALAAGSTKEMKNLLAIDKRSHRENVVKTCAQYDQMITSQMAQSTLVLAELYRRSLGWKFDDERFYFFANDLAYIPPGDGPAAVVPPVTAQQ